MQLTDPVIVDRLIQFLRAPDQAFSFGFKYAGNYFHSIGLLHCTSCQSQHDWDRKNPLMYVNKLRK